MKYYQGYQLITFEWVLFGLTVPFVAIRVYVQFYYQRRAYREIFTVLGLLCYLAVTISDTINNANGLNDETFDFGADTPQVRTILKMYYLALICQVFSVYFCKYVMLLFYMDLMPRRMYPRTWWFIMVTWGISIVAHLFTILAPFGMCVPFSVILTPRPDGDYCWMAEWYFVTQWSLHTVAELLAYAIPFVILRHLKSMRSSEKTAAYAMFAVGCVNVLCAICLAVLNSIPDSATNIDWDYWSVFYWFMWPIFQGTSIIIICLPQVRRFWLLITTTKDDDEESVREFCNTERRRKRSIPMKDVKRSDTTKTTNTTATSGTIDVMLSMSLEQGWWEPPPSSATSMATFQQKDTRVSRMATI